MTIWDLLGSAVRRWGVTLAGLLLTATAVFWVISVPEVYSSHVRVVLLPPISDEPNGYADSSRSLVHLAGAVAREIRGTGDIPESVSGDVTLARAGYHDGFEVRHVNAGGQWKYQFDDPVLDVQAVGATRAEAQSQMTRALQAVESTLTRMQDAEAVPAEDRVRTRLNPPAPQLRVEDGSRVRALAATVLAGVMLTLGILGSLGPARGAGPGPGHRDGPDGPQEPSNSLTKSRARASQL
ncbi:hypothetical protein [Cryobacterium tagatosivorans]|uniref:Polysaccharide chain length determinant N-terminal domain-containing protein n=1 Tax=Cryobacterium tagatosivorans TaxID=1259199 RepID=A0A4R8UE95_9MICO|nr:hypothetical protein [Cryobacterium tagatosivorans]TFB51738.1 hypothetical protein E3O23_07855 [Cryobacterium tagatosivorans]